MKVLSTFSVTHDYSRLVASRQNDAGRFTIRVQLSQWLLSVALLFCFLTPTYAANTASFKMPVQTFADRMNANLAKFNIPLTLTVNLEKGTSIDDFQHVFNEYVGLIGSIESKSQQLNGILLLTTPSESPEATAQNLQIIAAAFSALLDENQVDSPEMTEMIFGLLQESRTAGKSVRQKGKVRFTATANKDADIIFTAEPVL